MEKKTREAITFLPVQKLMRFFSIFCLAAIAISKAVAADPAVIEAYLGTPAEGAG